MRCVILLKKGVILLILLLLGLTITFPKVNPVSVEKIDLKLINDELAIIFITDKQVNLFLVKINDHDLLLVLDYDNNNLQKILNKFNVNEPIILTLNDRSLDIKYKEKITLEDYYYFNEISFKLKNNILMINYEENNFCIYVDRVNIKSNFIDCNFIYFYSIHNLFYSDINDDTDIVFYHYKKPLPTFLLEEIYKKWINTYTIRYDEFTIMKLNEEYYNIIVIQND